MLSNFLKISARSLVRYKLFSFINIIGLTISMAVGMIMIAMLSDLRSYDHFHEKKDRVYRVVTADRNADNSGANFASASVKAGKQIRATIPGLEGVTIIKNGIGGDATAGEITLPLDVKAADASFFTVFTFPLLAGNPATALKEPYSVVLTEKAAGKLFGKGEALGKAVKLGAYECVVTGVMKDIPKLSHLRFEGLLSFATLEGQKKDADEDLLNWENIQSSYVYLALPEKAAPSTWQAYLDGISATENARLKNRKITLSLQPLTSIALTQGLANQIGPSLDSTTPWVLGGLTFIVMLSACFNYTNLSIARSLRRSKEVGLRKVMGALRSQIVGQFITESVLISLLALVFSLILFLFLRIGFLSLHPFLSDLLTLDLSPRLLLYFVALAVGIGILAGFLPALFFSRINATTVLKDASSLQLFRRINLRKGLIVAQYTFSLIFISATLVGYKQYRGFVTFDLGFTTDNILNIRLQGNKAGLLTKELAELPAVTGIAQSHLVTNVGTFTGAQARYKNPADSAHVWQNMVDAQYLPLHGHRFLAGGNFSVKPPKGEESEVVVNEQVLKQFDIGQRDPHKAVGEVLTMDGRKLVIVGVLKDFHYGTLDHKIAPTVFRYASDDPEGYLNVKIASRDLPATLKGVENAWKKIDKVHPLEATFYNDQIAQAYRQLSVMLKVIGFLGFLAVCIASMGLLGMVVFTTETRLREIGIRKVLGADEGSLVFLLSNGFLFMLGIAALIAIPITYFFFEKVILVNFIYHQPVGVSEFLLSTGGVMLIAFVMIGSQTLKAARTNPAQVLKSE